MERIEAAILRTILYGDVFHFAMTPAEIQHFLISDSPYTLQQIEQTLATSTWLNASLHRDERCVAVRPELLRRRADRERSSSVLLPEALRYGAWLARLPFVRMVALTGALAMRNAADGDDIDYLLVTAAGRVWLTRLLAVVLVRLAKLRGIVLCPNYVLAENALEQARKDAFIAHEIAQMIPLYGGALHTAMCAENDWVRRYLPNADGTFHAGSEATLGGWGWLKRSAEWLLGGALGDALERWEYQRKLKRFVRLQQAESAAQLDETQVKGHFDDHGARVLRAYEERLRAYGVAEALPLAGD